MTDTDQPSYLEPLNPQQRQAVLHTGKPLLILAGAGSGKTRVITTKIAWLIREQGIAPYSILAVTFTNKAAREMAERARLIDERAAQAMLRTFHSFGAWFLRRNVALAGMDSNFVIYDDADALSLLSAIMKGAPKADVKRVAYNISRAKDYFLSPGDASLAVIDPSRKFRDLYRQYEERLAGTRNVDFGDLIKKPVEILRAEPQVAQRFRERFSVILVDEYQDANVAQFELLKALTGPDTYVCVVGDDDQSIYRFRGAEVKNILEFPNKFSGTEIIRLESNYRSTAQILSAASSVVNHNKGRLGKTLRSERGQGALPALVFLPNQDEEARFCESLIENSVKAKGGYSQWAVVYRTNAQSLGFETEFLRRGIPYQVVVSLKFYEREEIKDAIALLAFLANQRDEVSFRRVVNKPARGVGAVTVERLIDRGLLDGGGLLDTAEKMLNELTPKAQKGLGAFINVIKNGKALLEGSSAGIADAPAGIPGAAAGKGSKRPTRQGAAKKSAAGREDAARDKQSLAAGEGLSVCVSRLINDSGLAEYHVEQDEITGNQRLNNLQELANAASLYAGSIEGLLEFLEHIELDRSREEGTPGSGEDRATLITFHNTKGLEFKKVIMTGLEQGVFPREDKKGSELEEERRLFYVGATRAMDELYLTSCRERRMYGTTMRVEPSVFLREIDRNCLRITGAAPGGFNAGRHPWESGGAAAASETERESGWRRGQRLFHDDYGYGAVVEVRGSEDGPVVCARFDTGGETRFLSECQGSAFEKIGNDG